MKKDQADRWKQTCEDEMVSIKRLKVYKLVKTPENGRHIDTKWIFEAKEDE